MECGPLTVPIGFRPKILEGLAEVPILRHLAFAVKCKRLIYDEFRENSFVKRKFCLCHYLSRGRRLFRRGCALGNADTP